MESLQRKKNNEHKMLSCILVQSVGFAYGTIKKKDYDKFIDKLTDKKRKVSLEKSGIPFEDAV